MKIQDILLCLRWKGDNWADTINRKPVIKNLLYRSLQNDCFTVELQLKDFIPKARWQQAGLVLMEDSNLTAKGIRLSLAYNDFFGGYKRSPEIIIQAIVTGGNESVKPEEFIHHLLFEADSLSQNLSLAGNFNNTSCALKRKITNSVSCMQVALLKTGPIVKSAQKQ